MLRTRWHDEDLKVRTYTSLTGDFVSLGTATTYPFEKPTSGVPQGWTAFIENGGTFTDVVYSTQLGRTSIANVGTDIHHGKRYGIWRDFTIIPGKRYLVRVQARTTTGRTHTIRYVYYARPASLTWEKLSQVWSYDDWENVSLPIITNTSTSIRIGLMAAPYTMDPKGMETDANWGVQFQNVTLVEMEYAYPAPTWKELTCETKKFTCHYGRDKFTERYNTATAQITLDNESGEFGYGAPNNDDIRPGRFVKATVTLPNESTERPLYFGLIDSLTNSYELDGTASVIVSCVDTSTLLANSNVMTVGSRDDTFSSSGRFRYLLNSVNWHPSYMNAADGKFTMQTIVSNGRTIRDEAGIIGDSEGGFVFSDRDGVYWFHGRGWPATQTTQTTVQAELLGTPNRDAPNIDGFPTVANPPLIELRALGTDWSRDRIVNVLQLANQQGTSFTYTDTASQKKYGPFTYQRLDFVNVDDEYGAPTDYLDQRANDLMVGYTDAILRVNSVGFRPDVDAFKWASTFWLNDLVRVRYEQPKIGWGWLVVSHIQGFTHTFDPKNWEVSVNLDDPESFTYYQSAHGSGWDEAHWDMDVWDGFGSAKPLAYLTPSVGTATTPDPGPLPNTFVIIAMVDGPVNIGNVARMIVSQYESDPNRSWYVRRFATNGNVGMAFTATGSNANAVALTPGNTPITLGTPQVVGISVTLNTGTNTVGNGWYINASGVWTKTANATIATQAPYDSNTVIRVGANGASTNDRWEGKIYWVEMRTGLDPTTGTVVWRFDPNEYPGTGSSFVDARGRTWSLTNPAAITKPTG